MGLFKRASSLSLLCWCLFLACCTAPTRSLDAFGFGAPEQQGLDSRPLVKLTEWVRDHDVPILSILISRNGKVVYELYTSSLTREHAHYLMSVTKAVTSALVGVATDQHLIGPPETAVSEALPAKLFTDRARFAKVTIRDVLGMSALDAQVPPHRNLPEDYQRLNEFLLSPDRTRFALLQPLLPQPGVSFEYTDITALIATGIIEYASKVTALEFAEKTLFGPMGFRHYEWMHEDATGNDNGAYGLRLRPIDMQKFGILYLNGGTYGQQRLLSRDWVDRSFTPWIKTTPALPAPNYGWYWWTINYAPHWLARVAAGWKGQRIAVIPEQGMVITMTAIIEDQDEEAVFAQIIHDYVIPSAAGSSFPDPSLAALLEQVRQGPLRAKPGVEARMIPSVEPI